MTLGTDDRPVRVLLVEDNPGDVELTERSIGGSRYAHNLTVAEDGDEAMAILRKEGEGADSPTPDVVLLDLEMPQLDGIETLERLRQSATQIAAVVFTVFDTDERILNAVQAGARGYLLKGAPREEIFNAVRIVHQGGSLLCQTSFELAGGFVGIDRHALQAETWARVEPRSHLNDRVAGLGVAVEHGPLYGRGSTVLGEERAVEVDAS